MRENGWAAGAGGCRGFDTGPLRVPPGRPALADHQPTSVHHQSPVAVGLVGPLGPSARTGTARACVRVRAGRWMRARGRGREASPRLSLTGVRLPPRRGRVGGRRGSGGSDICQRDQGAVAVVSGPVPVRRPPLAVPSQTCAGSRRRSCLAPTRGVDVQPCALISPSGPAADWCSGVHRGFGPSALHLRPPLRALRPPRYHPGIGGALVRRARAGHLFLTISHPCLFLPPPHQTIWSTFSPCLRIWPILCTQFMTMARVVVGSGGSDILCC